MIQTQYYLSNLSSSYNILQDCGNCSRSVHERRVRRHGSSSWRCSEAALMMEAATPLVQPPERLGVVD